MAVLSDPNRVLVWTDWMRENAETVSITKADLRAAINAADDWANSNAAAYNTALPQPARGALTAAQKARILSYVIFKRWQLGA